MIRHALVLALCGAWVLSAGLARADFAAGAEAYDGGDYAAAYKEWRALAERGDATAQTAIAGMYRYGEGRPPDFATWRYGGIAGTRSWANR